MMMINVIFGRFKRFGYLGIILRGISMTESNTELF